MIKGCLLHLLFTNKKSTIQFKYSKWYVVGQIDVANLSFIITYVNWLKNDKGLLITFTLH